MVTVEMMMHQRHGLTNVPGIEVSQGPRHGGFWLPGGHWIASLQVVLVLGRLCGQVGFGHCWFECGKGLSVGMQW